MLLRPSDFKSTIVSCLRTAPSLRTPTRTPRTAGLAGLISLGILCGCANVIIPTPGTITNSLPTGTVPEVPAPTTFSTTLNSKSDFVGASIIQYWPMPMHNDGIAGQRSDQVLARFATTVLNHSYQRVIILCGTNDILQKVHNLTAELPANLKAMADIATNAGIEVVLGKLPPANANGVDLNATVTAANNAIAQMAAQNGYLIVDYYPPLFGHPEYFVDGVHPNAAGYAVMEKALSAIVLY